MEFECKLSAQELDDHAIHRLSLEICRRLDRESLDIDARILTSSELSGAKGDAMTVGTLLITILGLPAIRTLIEVLGTHLNRQKSLEVEITRPDGAKIAIKATDLAPEAQARTQTMLEAFVKPVQVS